MHTFATFDKALQSRMIKVIPGTGESEFVVHEHILSSCGSPSLSVLVSGDWKESAEGVIRWTEFDHEAILRVLQYLYYHDYTNPTPCVVRESNKDQHQSHGSNNPQALDDEVAPKGDFEDPDQAAHHEYCAEQPDPVPESEILDDFAPTYRPLTPIEEIMSYSEASAGTQEMSEVEEFPHERYSYKECFLAHAHVYRFAHYYSLDKLQGVALRRLISLLQRVNFAATHADADLAALVEFVYSQIPAETERATLRSTLATFVAAHYTALYQGEVASFFHSGGEFTADVAERLGRRINAGDSLVKELQAQLADSHIRQGDWGFPSRSSKKKKHRY